MLKRFFGPLAVAALALFQAGTDARAVPIQIFPENPVTLNSADSDYYFAFEFSEEEGSGEFEENFYLTVGDDSGFNLEFLNGIVNPIGTPSGGITDLQVNLTQSGNPLLGFPVYDDNVTNSAGYLMNAVALASVVLADAASYVLTLSGFYSHPAQYHLSFNVAATELEATPAVPIPPAALLFLTALGGVGWLGRRKARLTPA